MICAHLRSSMTEGSSSHKKIAEGGSWYLRLYYTNNVRQWDVCVKKLLTDAVYLYTDHPIHHVCG